MEKAEALVAGLGGAENIRSVEACITRLRVVVEDPESVSESALTDNGAIGVVVDHHVVHVVVGPIADELAEAMAIDS